MIKALYLLEHEDLLVLVHVDVFCVWQKPAWIIQRFSTINYSLQYITNEQSQWCQMQNKSEGARIIRNLDKQKKKKGFWLWLCLTLQKKCVGGGAKTMPMNWEFQVQRNLLKDDGASIPTSGSLSTSSEMLYSVRYHRRKPGKRSKTVRWFPKMIRYRYLNNYQYFLYIN